MGTVGPVYFLNLNFRKAHIHILTGSICLLPVSNRGYMCVTEEFSHFLLIFFPAVTHHQWGHHHVIFTTSQSSIYFVVEIIIITFFLDSILCRVIS